jgi:hypothetical protein
MARAQACGVAADPHRRSTVFWLQANTGLSIITTRIRTLKAVDRDEPEESKEEASKKSEMQEQFKKLFEYLKSKLPEVSDG